MTELGFSTYVFIERIAANAAALHPFPEHNVALVRDALADAGFDITLLVTERLGLEVHALADLRRVRAEERDVEAGVRQRVPHERNVVLRDGVQRR